MIIIIQIKKVYNMKNDNHLSIRLTDNQMLVLTELKEKLGCSFSVIIRAMVLDFLQRNEEALDRICSDTGLTYSNIESIINEEIPEDDAND